MSHLTPRRRELMHAPVVSGLPLLAIAMQRQNLAQSFRGGSSSTRGGACIGPYDLRQTCPVRFT